MTRRRRLLVVCFLLLATRAWAAPTPRDAYVGALTREQAVRTTLAAADALPAAVRDARAVVAAYQAVVRQYPTSGYADNALWQGGRLSIDLFLRFHDAQDRTAGLRLLRSLATEYPKSKLVKQIPEQIARATTAHASVPAAPPARPSAIAQPTSAHKLATLSAIRRTIVADTVRITMEFDGEVSFHDERLPNPLRVSVDLPLTQPTAGLLDRTLRFDGDAHVARQVRVGRQPNDATRIVVDATGISTYSIYPLYNPFRLVIDCVRGPEPRIPLPPLTSRAVSLAGDYRLPSTSPRWTSTITAAVRLAIVPPLASRIDRADWGRTLPAASPGGATLIASALIADVPPRLGARRIRSEWGRVLRGQRRGQRHSSWKR